jgi:hypothetical protein
LAVVSISAADKARPVGADRLDFRFDLPPLVFRRAQRVFDAAQLDFLVRPLLIRRRGRGGREQNRRAPPRRAERGRRGAAATCCYSADAAYASRHDRAKNHEI